VSSLSDGPILLGFPIIYYYVVMWFVLFVCVFMKVRDKIEDRGENEPGLCCCRVVLFVLFAMFQWGVLLSIQHWNQNTQLSFIAMAQTQVILTSIFLLSFAL
jgi:hypothetical protein